MYRIREAISMITKYVILLGLFALFASIQSLLRLLQEAWNKQDNDHLSRAIGAFYGFKMSIAFIIVLEMLVTDFSKIRRYVRQD